MTIEKFAVEMLKKGMSAKDCLAAVREVFPQSDTSIKCIYYYSSKYGIKLKKAQVVNDDLLKKYLAA